MLGRDVSGVGTGVTSALVVSSVTTSSRAFGCGMAGFLNPGAGGGGGSASSAASSPADAVLEGGVSSAGPASESGSLCLLVLPVSNLRTNASNVSWKSEQSSLVRCCFLSSAPYCFVNSARTAVSKLSTQLKCSKLW